MYEVQCGISILSKVIQLSQLGWVFSRSFPFSSPMKIFARRIENYQLVIAGGVVSSIVWVVAVFVVCGVCVYMVGRGWVLNVNSEDYPLQQESTSHSGIKEI